LLPVGLHCVFEVEPSEREDLPVLPRAESSSIRFDRTGLAYCHHSL